jgi:hypothetical protein
LYKESLLYITHSSFVIVGLGLLGVALKTSPTEQSYRQEVVAFGSRLALTSEPTRNPRSDAYLRALYRYNNEGVLRYLNLGLFSVVWRANYDPSTDVYFAQCSYLQPSYLEVSSEPVWKLVRSLPCFALNFGGDEYHGFVDGRSSSSRLSSDFSDSHLSVQLSSLLSGGFERLQIVCCSLIHSELL